MPNKLFHLAAGQNPTQTRPYFKMASYNFPTYAWGLSSNLGAYIVPERNLTRFVMISPGLMGVVGTVSFEAVNIPGYYLRHRDYFIHADPLMEEDLYKNDATFYAREDKFYNVII